MNKKTSKKPVTKVAKKPVDTDWKAAYIRLRMRLDKFRLANNRLLNFMHNHLVDLDELAGEYDTLCDKKDCAEAAL